MLCLPLCVEGGVWGKIPLMTMIMMVIKKRNLKVCVLFF